MASLLRRDGYLFATAARIYPVASVVLLVSGLGACGPGGSAQAWCHAAAEHLALCLGQGPAESASCDLDAARAVLALDCQQLDAVAGGKADGAEILCAMGLPEHCVSDSSPCAGRACGDACTLCAAGDTACALVATPRQCSRYGECLAEAALCSCPAVGAGRIPRGMWAWRAEDAVDPQARVALLSFASAHDVTSIFLHAPELLGTPAALTAFINEAAEQCIHTELLFGDPSWALAAHHDEAVSVAERAVAYVNSLTGTRPTALHFDVEPHVLEEWTTSRETIVHDYLQLIERLAAALDGSGLRLVVDTPFWLDAEMVSSDGPERALSELVLDRVDRVVLLDYRDHAEGSDGIIAHGATEVRYAGGIGREVVLGVETICGELDKITFCEEGAASLDAALAATAAAFAGAPGYAGVAVHHYGSYATLTP